MPAGAARQNAQRAETRSISRQRAGPLPVPRSGAGPGNPWHVRSPQGIWGGPALRRSPPRADGPRRNRFAEIYAAEFARKDVEIDPDLVRLAMEARYAARYTDPGLPGARRRSVFLSALRTARTLAERTDSG